MKKTILTILLTVATGTAFACGGHDCISPGSANAVVSGFGGAATQASTSASAVNNGTATQISGAHSTNSLNVHADTTCSPNNVSAQISGGSNGTTTSYADGLVKGNATGMSDAGSVQGGMVHGSANVNLSDSDNSFSLRNGLNVDGANGKGQGNASLGGVQGSFAKSTNVDNGYAYQSSGAGFQNDAQVTVGVDADANKYGPTEVDLSVSTTASGGGHSYVYGNVENAFGASGAGYIQGSDASGYADGNAREFNLTRRGVNVATAGGSINASSDQYSMGGALNVGDGYASNASGTSAAHDLT